VPKGRPEVQQREVLAVLGDSDSDSGTESAGMRSEKLVPYLKGRSRPYLIDDEDEVLRSASSRPGS